MARILVKTHSFGGFSELDFQQFRCIKNMQQHETVNGRWLNAEAQDREGQETLVNNMCKSSVYRGVKSGREIEKR